MNDMSPVIIPKSDQISADSLISGPLTITITNVEIRPGTEQPVSIYYEDDDGKPWRPCKSMSRVLVAAWGPDAKAYIGRSVTLYRDAKVKWGGMEVGGIRVSHLSHIDREMVLALTATKGKRTPFIVKPLKVAQERTKPAAKTAAPPDDDFPGDRGAMPASYGAGLEAPKPDDVDALDWAAAFLRALPSYDDVGELRTDWNRRKAELRSRNPEIFMQLNKAVVARAEEIEAGSPAGEDA